MQITSIADHPEHLEMLTQWHEKQWGTAWGAQVRLSTCRNRIPTIYIALDDGELLGTAMLVDMDMTTRTDISPWLGGVFVKPSRRGQGIGTALVRHAMEQAKKMGIQRLWLYTPASRSMYERLGWQFVMEDNYQGERVTIMCLDMLTDKSAA